jgi:flagella basal body P-ring formation protein FlgA
LNDFGLHSNSWKTGLSYIVCAKRDILPGKTITMMDLKQERWEKSDYVQDAFSDPNVAINRRAKFLIVTNQILLFTDVGIDIRPRSRQ